MFQNNIVKFQKKKMNKPELVENLPASYLPTDFCIVCIHFYCEKKWKYLIFLKTND